MNIDPPFKFARFTLILAALMGCSGQPKSPDDQAGLNHVSVAQDREKGVVTLGGQVASDTDKAKADSLARSIAVREIVANEIAVIPPDGNEVKAVNTDLDSAIGKNLDAVPIEHRLNKRVHYGVKNGVVRLTGDVDSWSRRNEAGNAAASVPHVEQVVNEIQIKGQKATSNN